MVSNKLYLLVGIILLLQGVLAQEDNIRLLAVVHDVEGMPGSVADLHLKIVPGTGKVFLSTRPLTKIDMQLSVQFAKEYACDYLDRECTNLDFFYTTHSVAPIVGGPSAGAAATALTMAVLEGIPVDQTTSVTGTINSGGSVGIVGGIREKITAAASAGITKVMIPAWEPMAQSADAKINVSIFLRNQTYNVSEPEQVKEQTLHELAEELGIDLIQVSHIEDVMREYDLPIRDRLNQSIEVPEEYTKIMKDISDQLCSRAELLSHEVNETNGTGFIIQNQSEFYLDQAELALQDGDYYPAASFCFGSAIRFRYLQYASINFSDEKIEEMIVDSGKDIQEFVSNLPTNISTMSDLQTLMVVKERVSDASKQLKTAKEALKENRTQDAVYALAYVIERLNSAEQWSQFFGRKGIAYTIDESSLRQACLQKLDEAQMRKQYINIFFPLDISGITSSLDKAYEQYSDNDYDQCIFTASKAKAEAETLISAAAIGSEEHLTLLVQEKLQLAEQIILREQNRDVFPLLGYSYYEYAYSLLEPDLYSSLVYAEYSLELSNLGIYFPKKNVNIEHKYKLDFWYFYAYGVGILTGMLLMLLILRRKYRHDPEKKK